MGEGDLDRTQRFFRSVNERILELAESFSAASPPTGDFLCECGDYGCLERLSISLAEFRAVAAAGGRYFVLRGHEDPQGHRVVDELGGALIVEPVR